MIVDETGEVHKSSHSQKFFKIDVFKTTVLESLFNKVADLQLYQKHTPTQVFSCEYREIFQNNFFYRTPPVATFGYSNQWKIFREITTSKF